MMGTDVKKQAKKKLAIIGGGPAALYLYKQLVQKEQTDWEVEIFERKAALGEGMPYSTEGSCAEHVTNISDVEIPPLVATMEEWIQKAPSELQQQYGIRAANFNEYKVVPRLLFGRYLSAQFNELLQQGAAMGLHTQVHLSCVVTDLEDDPRSGTVTVVTEGGRQKFNAVVICTGHCWPKKHEGTVPRYFDSPYPPAKLKGLGASSVAIRGASLTAMDAVRTLSREAGTFRRNGEGTLEFERAPGFENFQMVLHSLHGLLPAIRIHFDDFQLSKESPVSEAELQEVRAANDGFVPLDFVFDKVFREPFREKDPAFYEKIREWTMEEFVERMMDLRERLDAFQLFRAEYAEAQTSIRRKEPVHWKELLSVLSFAMNYGAKHFSAEDMLRLKKSLLPLISIVIAFVPQGSAQELLALHSAGVLRLVPVDRDSRVEPQPQGGAVYHYTDEEGRAQSVYYPLFVDCIGQPQLSYSEFPFRGLHRSGALSPARVRFRQASEAEKLLATSADMIEQDAAGNYYLKVSGLSINDAFQVRDQYGAANPRLYIMAVPYIGGLNPDYSGLDFCEEASGRIVEALAESGE